MTSQAIESPRRSATKPTAGALGDDIPEGTPMTRAYVPTGTERADLETVLGRRGVRLERATDAFERGECNWRGLESCGRTEFRIHRDPAGYGESVPTPWEVGLCCFTDALTSAQVEQDPNSDVDLVVETRGGV